MGTASWQFSPSEFVFLLDLEKLRAESVLKIRLTNEFVFVFVFKLMSTGQMKNRDEYNLIRDENLGEREKQT